MKPRIAILPLLLRPRLTEELIPRTDTERQLRLTSNHEFNLTGSKRSMLELVRTERCLVAALGLRSLVGIPRASPAHAL